MKKPEFKTTHIALVNNARFTYLEYTNGQFFQEDWTDGKQRWIEMARLPQIEEPKMVAH